MGPTDDELNASLLPSPDDYSFSKEDEENHAPNQRTQPFQNRKTSLRPWIRYGIGAVVLSAVISLGFFLSHSPPKHTLKPLPPIRNGDVYLGGRIAFVQEVNPSPCGNTSKQALERGCKFDLLSYSWLPEECIDKELSAEFMELGGGWKLYTEENAQGEEISLDPPENLGSQKTAWIANRYHLQHCTYMWRKLGRAVMGVGAKFDGESLRWAHMTHCSGMVVEKDKKYDDMERIGVRLHPAFFPC